MVGGVVCMILGLILITIVMRIFGIALIRSAYEWYSPWVWWPGIVLGFVVNRRTLQRAACLVWLPGLLWLAIGILHIATGWHPVGVSRMTEVRISLFPLEQGECRWTECVYVLFTTYPALNSITYSIGAAIALLINQDKIKN